MKIMILGADGYMGWPTSIHLALRKHKLCLIDNYTKRKLMGKYKRKVLIKSYKLDKKIKYLHEFNKSISFHDIDCTNSKEIGGVFKKFKPDVVIHYAELPSAPYSMLGATEGWKTLNNNLKSTFNLIDCVKNYNPDCHIIKLGTMGEYGTPNIDIEEGWINIIHNKRSDNFLYPRQGGSLYHTSKIMDTDLLWFYVRNFNLRVTDLMQGPVYGIYVNKFATEKKLETSFAYDDMFGTIINRFIVQGVSNIPLTIYGSGNQIRGYINLSDSIECVNLAIKNPPPAGRLNIYNQFTEQYSVKQLANKIQSALAEMGIKCSSRKLRNPRIEKEKHYYNAKNSNLIKLGLNPKLLDNDIIIEMAEYVRKYKKNIDKRIIMPKVSWK